MDNQPDQSVSFRRYALLHGWARWMTRLPDIEKQKEKLIKLRGTNWGVAVKDDILALEYQRLEFFSRRALYAVDSFGLRGKESLEENDKGPYWRVSPPDEIAAINRDSMAEIRAKSTRAKRLLESTGHLHCKTCQDNGFVMEGDRDYPCQDCHVEGIVQVVQVGDALS